MAEKLEDVAKPDEQHIYIAKNVCAEHGLDWDSLLLTQKRAILFFWCPGCKKTRELAALKVAGKKKVCTHCGEKIKLHATTKLTKIRRLIFYKGLEEFRARTSTMSMLFLSSTTFILAA